MLSHIKFEGKPHQIILLVMCWLVLLLSFAQIGTLLLPNQHHYLGGGEKHYLVAPLFWGWSNFDGEHYVAIARDGYRPLEHFFFPTYPLTLRYIAQNINRSQETFVFLGIAVSLISFVIALFGIQKLWKLDNPNKNSIYVILLFLLFPTSFYFISVYTESLFLALCVWSMYFARNKKFFLASILAFFASATKVIGFALIVALCIEWALQYKPLVINKFLMYLKSALPLLITPLGLVWYMYFLNRTTGDPLVFIHTVGVFGDQRSSTLILLPQVFFRYIVKIFPHLTFYWPVVFTTVLEFATGTFFFLLLILGLRKIRLSYLMYFFIGYIVPSFAGSFSSMPRYVLVLFPAFFLTSRWVERRNLQQKAFIYTCMTVVLGMATALFIRGYWVS